MTVAYFCILIASLLPIVWVGYAKFTLGFQMKDNMNPRELLAKAQGSALRAKWAQENSWEAFAPFAAAVLVASMCKVDQALIDWLAVIFITARVFHGLFYIMNYSSLRSLVWFIGMSCNFYLYYLSWSVA